MTDKITFLGTGDSMGVPRVYCDCSVCTEARDGGINRRLRSSIMLQTDEGMMLIDCGPDWTAQMERHKLRNVRHVLITHAHFDHIAGLPEWADACRWLSTYGNVYAPQDVLTTIRGQFPWLESHFRYYDIADGFAFGGWHIEPRLMCHGKNGNSYAYRLTKHSYRWAYCPDTIDWNERDKAYFKDLQLLILGTNFYKEEAERRTRSVYDMVEAMELVSDIKPERVVFTHMSHGVDLRERYALAPRIQLARTGMEIELPSFT